MGSIPRLLNHLVVQSLAHIRLPWAFNQLLCWLCRDWMCPGLLQTPLVSSSYVTHQSINRGRMVTLKVTLWKIRSSAFYLLNVRGEQWGAYQYLNITKGLKRSAQTEIRSPLLINRVKWDTARSQISLYSLRRLFFHFSSASQCVWPPSPSPTLWFPLPILLFPQCKNYCWAFTWWYFIFDPSCSLFPSPPIFFLLLPSPFLASPL